MLMATLYVMIINLDPNETTCTILEEISKEDLSESEAKAKVFEKLCKIFKTNETEPVRISIDLLASLLGKFKEKNIIVTKRKGTKKLNMDAEMEVEEEKGSNKVKAEEGDVEINLAEIKGMFDHVNVTTNYNNLYAEYGNKMKAENLDERFLLEEGVSANPVNVTPFARQGKANKLKDPKLLKNDMTQIGNTQFNSKRLLDYNANTAQNDDKVLTLSSQLKDIKFPNMIPSSPYSIKSFTPATPVSLALEMVNWLKCKASNAKKSLDADGFPPVMSRHLKYCKPDTKKRIIHNLDNWIDKVGYELKTDYNNSITGTNSMDNLRYLYFKLVDDLLAQEENNSFSRRKKADQEKITKELSKTLYRIEFHKAVFTCAAETILFIYNEQKLIFSQLLEFMNLSAFDFWKLVNSFIVVDPQMPTPLKRHFRDIEIKIVTELGWKFGSPILQIIEKILSKARSDDEEEEDIDNEKPSRDVHMSTTPDNSNQGKNNSGKKETTPGSGESPMTEEEAPSKFEEEKITKKAKLTSVEPHDLFFRRVLHLAAYKILTLADELELNDSVKEQLWEVMKKCLSYETQLLFNRHLDQLVLCTLYGVCKIQTQNKPKPVKFNDIIVKDKEVQNRLTGASPQMLQNMYKKVRLEGDNYGTIIDFYNKVYIPQMKNYIMGIGTQTQSKPNQPVITSPKPKITALAPQSPLRQSLPPSRLTYSTIYSSRGTSGTPLRYGMSTPGMRRMPMLAMTPRTKTLYAFGESATKDLERANTEIRKNSYKYKNASEQINFGSSSVKYRSSKSLKHQLIQSMKQGNKNSLSSQVIKEESKREEEED